MNTNTKEALKKFADAVELLAQGCVHMTGTEDAGRIISAAEALKRALDSDETIP